ncbi:MAG: hypothetical protein ACI4J2_05170 [Ruminococcus sp.]
MSVYDSRQINKMRQDAIRRSQEMHRRSMVNTAHYSQGSRKSPDLPPVQQEKKEIPETPKNNQPVQRVNQPPEILNRLFDGKIDSDKLMIIALMILLLKEGADMKLIIALAYILL